MHYFNDFLEAKHTYTSHTRNMLENMTFMDLVSDRMLVTIA